jgi:cytidine deaminase
LNRVTMTEDQRHELIQTAVTARRWAYAPYSRYPVGAALLTTSGRIYDGVNVENAAFPATICAERVAVFKAVSEGERQFSAIAVVTDRGGAPCGSCRQVLAEFGLDTEVIIADQDGNIVRQTTVAALLPDAFTPQDLIRGQGEGEPGL